MPDFASALKAEILRLARKEVRQEIEGLRKTVAQHRSELAELKRRLAALEKASAHRPAAQPQATEAPEEGEGPKRFNAKGFASHRKRLGISAAEAGALIGVSAQTVYGWENGSSRPRRSQLAAIGAFRKMGKRQVKARLEQAEG